MLAILEDHIALTEPPFMQDLYREVTELFTQFDWEHTQNAYEDLLLSSPGESGDAVDSPTLYNLTLGFTDQLLREHGIVMSDESHLRDHCAILSFIKKIETTEMVQECLLIINNEIIDNEEKFAQCVEYVIDRPLESTIEMIPTVPDSVIRTLKEYLQGRSRFMQTTEAIDPKYARMCNEMDLFARTIGGTSMVSYKHLFENNGVVGMEFKFYWNNYKQYLLSLSEQDLVYECIGFAIMSVEGMENPQKIILEAVNATYGNLETITNIQNALTRTLIEYRNKVTSGVARTE